MSKWPGSLPPASQGGRQLSLNSQGRGWGHSTLCHSHEIRGFEERIAPLVFLPGLHRWGEQPLPDLPLPGKAALGHDSWDGGNLWVPPPRKPRRRRLERERHPRAPESKPSRWPCPALGVSRLPLPHPRPPPRAQAPRSTRTSVPWSLSLSAAGSRRPLGWVRRPLGPLRGWRSRAGRAGQSQEHFGGGGGGF